MASLRFNCRVTLIAVVCCYIIFGTSVDVRLVVIVVTISCIIFLVFVINTSSSVGE